MRKALRLWLVKREWQCDLTFLILWLTALVNQIQWIRTHWNIRATWSQQSLSFSRLLTFSDLVRVLRDFYLILFQIISSSSVRSRTIQSFPWTSTATTERYPWRLHLVCWQVSSSFALGDRKTNNLLGFLLMHNQAEKTRASFTCKADRLEL